MNEYDVAVVGAGPAGSWTATELVRRGARVALIDGSHPREKPCGGGVTARALSLVSDVIGPSDLQTVAVARARFLSPEQRHSPTVSLKTNGQSPLVVADRAHFDVVLYEAAQRAGAVAVKARAIDVRRTPRGFDVRVAGGSSVSASWLVGADGVNGLVRRRLASPFRRDELSIATGFFAHGITSDEIVLEFVSDPAGYIWSFPRRDHLAIGVCAQAEQGLTVERLRARVAEWIRRTGIARAARLTPYSWPIPSLGLRDFDSTPVAGDRWLTVGDAAGLVDPITREGIFFALQSALIAADAIASARSKAEQEFRNRLQAEIVRELMRAAALKERFFQPRFTSLLIGALRKSAPVRAVMADLVAGAQSYATLKWRLAKTLEVRLAWNALRAWSLPPGNDGPVCTC